MNAVANSHLMGLGKSLTMAYLESPQVTFDRGARQEELEGRAKTLADRPDTFTNSVMLDFPLTRPRGHGWVEAPKACSP
jgi:hypothetical protein